MTASDPRVGEIQARLDAATPGPWFQGREGKRFESEKEVYSEREPSRTSEDICTAWHPVDAEFIAAAPADVAYLLAELRDRDEKLARVEYVCADWAELADGDKYYASKIRAAVAAANGGGE